MTIGELFPRNTGRVQLLRVALKLRMPELLKLSPTEPLPSELRIKLETCLLEIAKG
jgi:hypothetical protein